MESQTKNGREKGASPRYMQASAPWNGGTVHTHMHTAHPRRGPRAGDGRVGPSEGAGGPAPLTMNAAGLRGARPAAPCPGGRAGLRGGTSGGGSGGRGRQSAQSRADAAQPIRDSGSARQAWLAGTLGNGAGPGRGWRANPGSPRPRVGGVPPAPGALRTLDKPLQARSLEMRCPAPLRTGPA